MDDKNKNNAENGIPESNEAKRLRALGEDGGDEHDKGGIKINKAANFWYHNKVKILLIAFFAFVIIVAGGQFLTRSNPDVKILYAGPGYITANENQAFCKILDGMIPDFNGDGKKYVQLNDLIFMSSGQIEEYIAEAEERGEDVAVDRLSNKQTSERFTYEVFGSESVVCILARDQYDMVKNEGGFMTLDEIFDGSVPDDVRGIAVDEYGVLFKDTKLCRFYSGAQIFPDDAVLAMRRLSTLSALTGKKKAEKYHGYSTELFRLMLEFEYPEGYDPENGGN